MRMYWKMKDWLFDLKMWWQRKTRGYSDIEVWNLDSYTAKWVLPRLKAYKEQTIGYPEVPGECESFNDWQDILDEMIYGLEFAERENEWYESNVFYKAGEEKENAKKEFKAMLERAQKGRELFGKYFTHLWW